MEQDELEKARPAVTPEHRAWLEDMALKEEIAEFEPGLYRHYKGGLYSALGLIIHHETRLPMVRYVSHTYGGENVRPLIGWPGDPDGWNDWVDAKPEGDGFERVRRFAFVGELPSNTPISER
jgi:hypothetical protein